MIDDHVQAAARERGDGVAHAGDETLAELAGLDPVGDAGSGLRRHVPEDLAPTGRAQPGPRQGEDDGVDPDLEPARRFEDEDGLCGAPIEDHHDGADTAWHYLPEGTAVGIPYRTLLVRDAANVLVAGRCFSATHDAHAAVRSMAQCVAMGQAAGTAAALAVATDREPRDVPAAALRDRLRAAGAIVDPGAAGPAAST